MNMFWQHCQENKKLAFLAFILEQVHAPISESSKNKKNYFRTPKPTFVVSMKFPLEKKWRQAEMVGSLASYQPASCEEIVSTNNKEHI